VQHTMSRDRRPAIPGERKGHLPREENRS